MTERMARIDSVVPSYAMLSRLASFSTTKPPPLTTTMVRIGRRHRGRAASLGSTVPIETPTKSASSIARTSRKAARCRTSGPSPTRSPDLVRLPISQPVRGEDTKVVGELVDRVLHENSAVAPNPPVCSSTTTGPWPVSQ